MMTHAPNQLTAKLLVTLLAATATGCASIPHPGETSKLAAIRPVQTGPVAPPGAPADGLYADAANAILGRDYGRALDILQLARQRDPKDIRVLNAFGVVYDKLGRFDLSARYYAQARMLDPNSSIVVANLAYSRRLQTGEGDPAPANAPVAMAATTPAAVAVNAVAPVQVALITPPAAPVAIPRSIPIPPARAPVSAPRAQEPPPVSMISAPAAVERVKPVHAGLTAISPPTAIASKSIPTPQAAPVSVARAQASAPRASEPLRQIAMVPAPAAVERVRPVHVALTPVAPPAAIASKLVPTPQAAPVPVARAQASAPRASEPLRQIAMVPAPAAVERVRPVHVALTPVAPPAAIASKSIPTPQAAPVPAARAQASASRASGPLRQMATGSAPAAVERVKLVHAVAVPVQASGTKTLGTPRQVVRPATLKVSLVAPRVTYRPAPSFRSSFWTRHSPLVLINASGSQNHAETLRTHLVRTGWSAPGWAVRQASRQKVTFIRYPASRRTTALALAATLPGPVRLSVCVSPCVGLQLVLGSDALRWNPMGRWMNKPRRG